MRSHVGKPFPAGGVVDQMRAIGWSTLDSVPRREIVLGAVTQPWRSDVVFSALSPEEFIGFHEPGFVKIVVVIAADPVDESNSIFRIETLVATTDSLARKRFRRYWSVFSPGILLIRQLALGAVKRNAEERYRRSEPRFRFSFDHCHAALTHSRAATLCSYAPLTARDGRRRRR